jgi:hypothetical protein
MAVIVIKDLPESVELDREAMAAIVGGARGGGSQSWPPQRRTMLARLIQYPAGFPGTPFPGTPQPGKPVRGAGNKAG